MSAQNKLLAYRNWHRSYWLVAAVGLVVFVALEGEFHLIEKGIGQYLVWQNAGREKVGRSWQLEQNRLLAGTRLERISGEMRERERQLETIATFPQLVQSMEHEKQKLLPPLLFARIYDKLPIYMKPLIISTDSVFAFRVRGSLDNVLFNQSPVGLEIVFLGRHGEVLHNTLLANEQKDILLHHGEETELDVQTDPRFAGRVFMLSHFQERLVDLPYQTRQDFFAAMPALIESSGPTTRVAISNKIVNELVEVAVTLDNFRAYLYYIPEDWIIEFISTLNDEDFLRDENKNFL